MVIDFRYEYRFVPIKYACTRLNRIEEASKNAVYDGAYGWICDCGAWTLESKDTHTALKYGRREVFVRL